MFERLKRSEVGPCDRRDVTGHFSLRKCQLVAPYDCSLTDGDCL